MAFRITLQRALLGTVVAAILVGVVPAGFALDRRLAGALIAKERSDLEMAPHVLADRMAGRADVLKMHAMDFARSPGLAEALSRGDRPGVEQVAQRATPGLDGSEPVVVASDGRALVGPPPDSAWVDATRRGGTTVSVGVARGAVFSFAIAPVEMGGTWTGAAGLAYPVDARDADALARLTRADVTILVDPESAIAVTTLDSALAEGIRRVYTATRDTGQAVEYRIGRRSLLAVAAPLGDTAHVIFSRDRDAELAVIPELHRVALISALLALAVAITLGAVLATRISRPARELSAAASAIAQGSFDAPLPRGSRIDEVASVAGRFEEMRETLRRQMTDLRRANEALADRNARLVSLQADLMQRDRLAATGRLVTQLAHEIRNPVANLRNLLELVRRRVDGDPQAIEYADLAIDELLRMHELAEQMLDLNRPRDPAAQRCDAVTVVREVARLASAGALGGEPRLLVRGSDHAQAAMAPDALKQVLVNLVQNAREAVAHAGGRTAEISIDITQPHEGVSIAVQDNGPGVPDELRERIFDPFFTTKGAVHGVGLGLFVAEGLVRSAGGRLTLETPPGGGARFVIELPPATSAPATAQSAPASATS